MKTERAPTPFEKSVYKALQKIPCGKVVTYGELARYLGAGSARAVGQALKRNPDAPQVPCHRVIRSNRTLGGYQGDSDSSIKKRLLCREGVRFEKPDTIDHSSLYQFNDNMPVSQAAAAAVLPAGALTDSGSSPSSIVRRRAML